MKFIALLKKASPGVFIAALTVSVLSGICSTLLIRLIHRCIDADTAIDDRFYGSFAFYVIGFGIFGSLSSYFISVLTQSMIYQLRTDLSSKILSASFQKTEQKLDKILPVLTADINFVSASMNRLPPVVTGLATSAGCVVYLFLLSWKLTLSCLVLFGIAFLINFLTMPYLKKLSEQARNVWDQIHKNFEGVVYGMKELKLNRTHRENYLHTAINPHCLQEQQIRIKEETLYATSARIMEMILFAGIGLFIYSIDAFSWIDKDTFGDYLLVLLFTVAPLATVSGYLKHVKRTQVSLQKIEQIGINLENEKLNDIENLASENWHPAIDPLFSLQDIFFSYGAENNFAIGPVNLDVMHNEIIYIVGGNGTGKTTFIKLLTGLYTPTKGALQLKKQPINESQYDFYRQHFAGVFTDYHLFEDLHHIAESKIKDEAPLLLRQLEIDHKVQIKGKTISTTKLSYGQRKRLAMMVSILEDKDIYIFDEWAANQDPHFKEKFYCELLPQLKAKGKTIVAISHDQQYFPYADRVFEMIDGQLQEYQVEGHVYGS